VNRVTRTVLVTGATGAVGPRVVCALADAGFAVRTLSRDAPPAGAVCPRVEAYIGDVADRSVIHAAVRGVDAVVHMAALLHIVNPPASLRGEYERVNVCGTKTVTQEAINAGVRRLIFFSTISVYGPSDGKVLTEASPAQPSTLYAQTKYDAERIVLSAQRADGTPLGVVLRLSAVYGARIKGNYQRLLTSLARGQFVSIGDGRNRRTLIYDRDVARAVILAVQCPQAAGQTLNVTDGRYHTMSEVITAMCRALGRDPPRVSLAAYPIRLAAGVLERGALLVGRRSPVLRATIDKYTEDVAVDGERIRSVLGFVPQFDLVSGWRETVLEMRRMGDL
jgi:nucleoside-diphosphate-sugar epimerase